MDDRFDGLSTDTEAPEQEAPAAETEYAEDAEELAKSEPDRPDYLEMTIQSCVLPLEMRFSQINSPYRKVPRAYRSYTFINSVIEGVIPPEKYSFAADQTERGVRLTKWNIAGAIGAVREFEKAGRHVDFVTARVSPQIVREADFYGYIKEILDEHGFTEPDKLCLEFPKTVLFEDAEQTRMALLGLKLLKVKSALSGCGDRDSALTPIFNLPFDYVILASWLSAMASDRTKVTSFESLLGFFRGLEIGVIADGVANDAQIRVLSRFDCYGYIPSSGYHGDVEHGRLRMPLNEAVLQEEESI